MLRVVRGDDRRSWGNAERPVMRSGSRRDLIPNEIQRLRPVKGFG